MKRFHLSIAVADLEQSGRYYRQLFGREPDFEREDYQQWLLDEPALNFSLKSGLQDRGINHVGMQVDSEAALKALRARIAATAMEAVEQNNEACCYARSDKSWLRDPDGVAWEIFLTHGREETPPAAANDTRCCERDDGHRCCA